MPKIVDHAERRRDIIAATWRVMTREGLTNTTMREIAKEARCSTGVLSHYFTDRADILASALIAAHLGVRARIDHKIRDARGLAALRLFMIEVLPLNDQGLREARIEACFWGEAIGNDALMKIQNEEVDNFCKRVRAILVQAESENEIRAGINIDQAVHECLILTDGLSIQSVMYPSMNDVDTQILLLEALLARIAADPST
jgi:AcrR family transcriptional regulator